MRLRSILSFIGALLISATAACGADMVGPVIRVGGDTGDLRGTDHRALQAAVDYVANLGGGRVEIAAGRYSLRHPLTLRSRVHIVGVPGRTVLVLGEGRKSALARDVERGATEIVLAEATGFEIGDAIAVEDSAGQGFGVTTATLIARRGPRTFQLSQPAVSEYRASRAAIVKHAYSGVAAVDVTDASVSGITIEGNHGTPGSEYLGGCRGGGIYLHSCKNVVVRECVVRRFNGDAISFQRRCQGIVIERCVCEHNANVGMHPGSDSHDCVVRGNTLRHNGYVGLFVCVGVRKVLFEDNAITANAGCGISIGYGDSDNVFRGNRVTGNAETGVLFRRDSPEAEHGAHRNLFEKNVITDNLGPRPSKSNSRESSAGQACIVIEGAHHDLVFRDNVLGFTKPHPGAAFLVDNGVQNLRLLDNQLRHVARTKQEHRDP